MASEGPPSQTILVGGDGGARLTGAAEPAEHDVAPFEPAITPGERRGRLNRFFPALRHSARGGAAAIRPPHMADEGGSLRPTRAIGPGVDNIPALTVTG
jgi:hypothetical protein